MYITSHTRNMAVMMKSQIHGFLSLRSASSSLSLRRTALPPRPLILRACASNPDHDRFFILKKGAVVKLRIKEVLEAASQEAEADIEADLYAAEDSEIHEVVEKRPKSLWGFVSREVINAILGVEMFAMLGMCIGFKNWVKQYPIVPILLFVSVIALKYALYKTGE
ncbi:hypothetical protein HanRHA438_Chr11g0521801 [Helianthus annuus]|uniref:uncharacterized protein LOC110890964 isoform X2 n=1 Tax=Helianthus annuus TaxID=4232 RepID=UPI000B8F6701|nr:uncharacterized protein LOC110890964 isoform X2 [Helianthus annuus]XP_021994307.1 uncharacterized protein LOC110890966 isoform X2 [Helianthus annuus]XP_021994313.1 uncharacterized protein LOC110890967 isoform X4 [Helianthus annuus]XP_021994348.1 uncharacterized protein LOC110890998 isoform X2 [Helianthus annuus]XP_035835936.1 uncharacterized protein LOC110890964 isoform X2 [Helianthus annuus]XP_035835937.1 uncharacterized protein LOC110890966 isoform X2 [Helianthus annuus]XP_035835939.1 un